jgi:DNA repair exonuclease SbcCD ATPase subunit
VNVSRVELDGFTKHEDTVLDFPERGLVVVTGPNGGGKSSIPEAVAWGAFGETLRGTHPGGDGKKPCCVRLETDAATAERIRKSGSAKLSWTDPEGRGTEYPTTTKAQDALEAVIGGFESWRRTHVFSSADAAHFTMATDKERKLFLEAWLGLGRFDAALERCRAELRGVQTRLDASTGRAQMLQREAELHGTRREDAERTLAALPPAPPLGGHGTVLANLRHSVRTTEASLKDLRKEQQELASAESVHRQEAVNVRHRLGRLSKPGATCGECGQTLPVDVAARTRLEQDALAAEAAAKGAREAKAGELEALAVQLSDDEKTLSRLREREAAASREAGAAEQAGRSRKTAEDTLARAAAEQQKAEALRQEVEQELPSLRREATILTAAEAALGLRGARAGMLTRLLSGLEAAANGWLARLAGPGLRLELKPYSERKAGGLSDAIGITVLGAGGGEGYKASSGGERRRIDLALLLAFAGRGTLFLDEVMDALDDDGIEAVVDVLAELAKDRAVVLITHNESLAARAPAALRWKVEAGRVS